jgi:hypothetical protein
MESEDHFLRWNRNSVAVENGSTNHTWERHQHFLSVIHQHVSGYSGNAKSGAQLAVLSATELDALGLVPGRGRHHEGALNMRRSQGRPFSTQEISRIKFLLSTTDLTLEEIAIRMDCAKSSVVAINRAFQIRHYLGRRSSWVSAREMAGATEQAVGTMPEYKD